MDYQDQDQSLFSESNSSASVDPLTQATGRIGAPTLVSMIPAMAMVLGYLVAYCARPGRIIQAIFQNLSAGVIIGSVAGELFPLLGLEVKVTSWQNNFALFSGFLLAIGIMFGLDKLLDICEDDGEDDEEDEEDKKKANLAKYIGTNDMQTGLLAGEDNFTSVEANKINLRLEVRTELRERFTVIVDTLKSISLTNRDEIDEIFHRLQAFIHACKRQMLRKNDTDAVHVGLKEQSYLQQWVKQLLDDSQHLLEHLQETEPLSDDIKKEIFDHIIEMEKVLEQAEQELEAAAAPRIPRKSSQRRWKVLPPPSEASMPKSPVAWSFVIAVCVDAFVDGFLSGLSFHAKPIAGYIMAGATCIEMGFLGITFVGTVRESASSWVLGLICATPLCTMVFGGFLSGVIGEFVRPGTAMFEGLIAFCIVALLFLVTQELLTGAHENLEGREIVWVNMMIFVGILIVMIVERITASSSSGM